jgi:hypothetical protein
MPVLAFDITGKTKFSKEFSKEFSIEFNSHYQPKKMNKSEKNLRMTVA